MPNYKLTSDGMTTRDPVIAAMVLGQDIEGTDANDGSYDTGYLRSVNDCEVDRFSLTVGTSDWNGPEIRIPYAALKSAIAPVEGEAFVEIGFGDVATDGLILYGANDTMTKPDVEKRLNWRVIILCQDYGDLRELLAAIERRG